MERKGDGLWFWLMKIMKKIEWHLLKLKEIREKIEWLLLGLKEIKINKIGLLLRLKEIKKRMVLTFVLWYGVRNGLWWTLYIWFVFGVNCKGIWLKDKMTLIESERDKRKGEGLWFR